MYLWLLTLMRGVHGMTQNKFMVFGITGISGSGTSTVAELLQELIEEEGGYFIAILVEADEIAHEVMLKGNQAYDEIVSHFGKDILNDYNEIDRQILGKIVFNDEELLTVLKSIIHPHVIKITKNIINSCSETEEVLAVIIDAPLLIESGMNSLCDYCWLVTAPNEKRLERIQARDNISLEMAELRLKNRVGDEALRPYVNAVIENDGDKHSLMKKVQEVFETM